MDFRDCLDDESHMVHCQVIRNESKIMQLHHSLNQVNLIIYNFLESLGGLEAYKIFEPKIFFSVFFSLNFSENGRRI